MAEINLQEIGPCVIGITGGLGSGKSTVASFIGQDFTVLDSDVIARRLMEEDEHLRERIVAEFGPDAYHDDGGINTQQLATTVFNNTVSLRKMNDLVHPLVVKELERQIDELHSDGENLIFIESALIFEAGIENMFHYIIAVIANEETVFKRLSTQGWNRSDFLARSAGQLPPDEKARRSDFSIINDNELEELSDRTKFITGLIQRLCKRK